MIIVMKRIILLNLRLFLPCNILDNFLYSKLFNMFLESAEFIVRTY